MEKFNLNDAIPEHYQYYEKTNLGGRPSADYCPVSQEVIDQAGRSFYVGHCSIKGSGEFGSLIMHYRQNGVNIYYSTNGELASITGENNSENSFCVLSSLISKSVGNSEIHSKTVNALCYQMYCSEQSLTIQINDDFFVCPRSGGKINAVNYDGYLLCPDYYLICSGTVLCNEMFDCVEKESLLKEDINYDYEIKTSQDLYDAEDAEFSEDGYELTTNGKCPQNCKQCNLQGYCIKCRNGFGIVELNNGGVVKRECMEITNLAIGYYIRGNIYYKCIDNCDHCDNGSECIDCNSAYVLKNGNCFNKIEFCVDYDDNGYCIQCQNMYIIKEDDHTCKKGTEGCENFDEANDRCLECNEDYRLSNGLCYRKIDNCEQYGENELCSKCVTGYVLKGNDRENCYLIEQIGDEYYSKDNGIIYFRCDDTTNEGIENCINCEYISSNLICHKCQASFVLKDEETNICYERTNYQSNKYYVVDEFHINSCSVTKNNCDECQKLEDNSIKCTKCQNNYILLNNECYPVINNCQNYNSENGKCQKCENGFAFEKEDRDNCKSISNIFAEGYYTKDNGLSYYKCDDTTTIGIDNCHICEYISSSNALKCTRCKTDINNMFVLLDDDSTACYPNSNYENNNQYYYDSPYHVRTCSRVLNNCVACEKTEENGEPIINCLECTTDYSLFNDDVNRNCKKPSEIANINKYYIDNSQYYLCSKYNLINNCEECSNQNSCTTCKSGFTFLEENEAECISIESLGEHYIPKEDDPKTYKRCSSYMDNCDTCQSKNICKSCLSGFGLFNDRKTCIILSEEKHYKDDDNLYYLCNNGISNCEKCSSKNECIKCGDGFVKKNNDKTVCYSISGINLGENEYFIDPNDENNYITCSYYVDHCKYCDQDGCVECESEYILLNENGNNCYLKSSISDLDSHYYTLDDGKTYLSCEEKKYKNDFSCFTKVPGQIISLKFLQAQIIDNKLHCFMITHSPLPNLFSLKLKINKYTIQNRNLEGESEIEVILTTNEDSNGINNKIIDFTSNIEYLNEDVEIKEIDFDSTSTITSTVTEHNECSLIFDADSKLIDTGRVRTMISENEVPDCSDGAQKSNIVNLVMNSIDNC